MKKKFVLFSSLFCVLFLMSYKAYLQLTDNFAVENIVLELPHEKRWEMAYKEEEIENVRKILSQSFRYLAKGRQSYAFESDDGQYVLKFMKCQRFKMHWLAKFLPGFDRKMKLKRKRKKELFSSYYIAKNECSDECALVFLQLNSQPFIHKTVKLIDKLGRVHEVDIDKTPFVIQRKITPVFTALQKVLENGDTKKTYSLLKQITDTVAMLSKRGIRDADPALIKHQNIGFYGDTVAYIDIGTFKHVSRKKRAKFIRKDCESLTRLCDWLQMHDPKFSLFVQEQIAQSITAAKNE